MERLEEHPERMMCIVPNQSCCCLDCVHPIDESGQCLIAKMFEKPVNPEHGCSWRVPIKRKAVLTNADLIDRDAVLHDVSTECSNAHEAKYYEAQVALTRAKKIIRDAPAVNRWIPCSERLPEVYEKVLTYSCDGIIHDNFRLNLRDGSVGWSQGWGITHWQPRPEPPEMER